MICKIGKSLAEIENFLKEKYIQEMVLAPADRISQKQISCRNNKYPIDTQ